ncbi:MAG: zinc-ribbon and DUF3426 domain-containing protein [Betaproteobacteria bacterium]
MSSLATRCRSCGTVFRVVADQLRVSEGWVRCGRCLQVFNALEGLVDLETGLPLREGAAGLAGEGGASGFEVAQPAPRPGSPPLPAPATSTPPGAPTEWPPGDATLADTPRDRTKTPPVSTAAAAGAASPAPAPALDDLRAEPALAPSFVRQADRAARWRRPGVRAALAGMALLAATLLAAQVAHTWRDRLAARAPALAPLLEQGCDWLGCEVGPARLLDALSVESSGLLRVERSNLYKLQVSLRNRAEHPVALPALDLSLTDARGQLVARRVLQPADLGASAATIPPGRDLALQATLQSTAAADGSSRVIAGYTVEMFYP